MRECVEKIKFTENHGRNEKSRGLQERFEK